MKIISLDKVMEMTGLARSTIYKHMANQYFPKAIQLGMRCVGWVESEVLEWIQARIAERDQ